MWRWFFDPKLNSPLPQVLYFVMMFGGYGLTIWNMFPSMGDGQALPAYHQICSFGIVVFNLFLYVRLRESHPGSTSDKRRGYSRYCKTCEANIQGHDHHCIWIKNCIGADNWLLFMGFLCSHALMCAYGLYLGYQILRDDAEYRGMKHKMFIVRGRRYHWSLLTAAAFYATAEPFISLVSFTCALMFVLLVPFALFQLYTHCWLKSTTSRLLGHKKRQEDIEVVLVNGKTS